MKDLTQHSIYKQKEFCAYTIPLGNANLLLIKAAHGYIMCGYLNLDVAEKFGDAACVVSGVSNIDEALAASIKCCTSAAKKLGIVEGMPVKMAITHLSS